MGFLDAIANRVESMFDPTVSEAPSGGGGGSGRNPLDTLVRRIGLALGVGSSRNEPQPPEFDLTEITNAYNTEAYVRQAIDKYIELMFKAGWSIVGPNETAVEYINLRFKLMAEMTQVPTDQLFIEIAEDLVKYSNSVIVKARDKQNLLGSSQTGVNAQGLGGQPPVVGYFPLNVTTLSVVRDRFNTIRRWEQEVEGGDRPVRYNADQIVHIYYKREKGRAFGTPFLLSALDDIRALRQAEENVLRLIYRNLNPLLHIQVGNEEIPAQQPEIDTVRTEFETMDLEAGFVTSERVTLNAVASDKIIDAKEYVKYFEQRVFTGLGVSELMMGRGNTANRSTGDNLSGEFTDRVKAFQKVMSIFVDEFIIKELLMEGGFDPVLNPDDDVDFVFNEIDVDAKIKAENHAIFQYEHNAITEDEMRTKLGLDPITDRAQMFMNLVTIPVATETANAKAAASGTSSGASGTKATNNKNKPQNQHKTKTSPKKESTETEFQRLFFQGVEASLNDSHTDIIQLITEMSNVEEDLKHVKSSIRETEASLTRTLEFYLGQDYVEHYKPSIYRLCERLHDEIVDTVLMMGGQQKEQMIFETIGGIYHVLEMRMNDIAMNAYQNYADEEEVQE